MTRLRRLFLALGLLAAAAPSLAAQADVPSLRWQTIRTEHFRIHYEPQLEAWAQKLASEMESVRLAVAGRIDYTPPQVIDILVEDPLNTPNGNAWPFLYSPAMRFWATPPSPASGLGNSRGWGEILSVHEYAHLAHLLRPSRAPFANLITFFSGIPVGPIAFGAPAWIAEGYATLIEGELTGAGRPNGVARPALIRTLALEGNLPTYGELDATARFQGGSMRYLLGSAYLEWLQAQHGDSVLPRLWRRSTAREKREFVPAFTGLFGDAPDRLYGNFTAEVIANAQTARRAIEAQGLAQGTLVQHWDWAVGTPAVSPNGKFIAVRRALPSGGSRVLVLAFPSDSMTAKDSAAAKKDSTERAKRREKDPEDVEDIQKYPKPLRVVASIGLTAGAAYDSPRWLPDGEHLLLSRVVPLADGRARPDLFTWNYKTKKIRRITRAAGIMQADALPDGKQAAALTCGSGTCSLLMVDLATGNTRGLAAGGIDRSYAGVRVSPDGKRVVSSRQRGALWDLVVVDIASGNTVVVGPQDGASRYSATWANDSTIVAVSEANGIQSIERIPLAGTPTVIVRTVGAASAPDVAPDGRTFWLDLHSRGYDLRVNDANSSVPMGAPLDVALAPVVRRVNTRLARTFDSVAVAPSRDYGAGPFGGTLLASTTTAPDGDSWSIGGNAGDPLGRVGMFFQAGSATRGGWFGGNTALTLRRFRPELQLQLFSAGHDPSRQGRNGGATLAPYDLRYNGGLAAVKYVRYGARGTSTVRLGLSTGSIDPSLAPSSDRAMGFASFATNAIFTKNPTRPLLTSLAVQYASGSTNNTDWHRVMGEAAIGIGGALGIRARGGETSANAPIFEQFVVGGTASPYIDAMVLSQRVEHLALPFGMRGGRRMAILSAETTGPFRLYHDWIAAGEELGAWDRVIGAEVAMQVPGLGVLRIPNGALKGGVSHGLEGMTRNATIGYLAVTFTP